MSNIIRIGSATRSITTNYTDQERNVLGRELADKIGELSTIDARIKAVYELRETEVLALEDQRKTLSSDIERLQVSVSTGVLEELIQCDVYEVDGAERIVVKSGCLPTDAAAIIETTALNANEEPLPGSEIQPEVPEIQPEVPEIQPEEEPLPGSEIQPEEEPLPGSEIQPEEEPLPGSEIQPEDEAPEDEEIENI
jgi:hypothetical protein